MALIKLEPELKVLIQPRDNIVHREQHAVTISDVLTSMVLPGGGTSSQGNDSRTSPWTDTQAETWAEQSGFKTIDPRLEVIRFKSDGTAVFGADAYQGSIGDAAKELSGFFVKPYTRYKNNVVNNEPVDFDPEAKNDYESLQWNALEGDAWKTYVPYTQPYRNYIRHADQWPDKTLRIETKEPLELRQGFSANIIWRGIAALQKGVAGYRMTFCNGLYSIEWRGGHAPRLCRRGTGGNSKQWQIWKPLDGSELSSFDGETDVMVYPLGGQMVVQIDNLAWHVVDTWGSKPTDFRWPKGKVEITSFGVDAGISLSLLDFYEQDGETIPEVKLEREVEINVRRDPEEIKGYAKGHWPINCKMLIVGKVNYKEVKYKATLITSGRETPLLSAALLDFPPSVDSKDEEPLNITPALENNLTYTSFEPGITDTAEVSFKCSRVRLSQIDATWQDTLKQFSPVTVDVRWKYQDTDTCEITSDAKFTRLFEGYVVNPDMATVGENDQPLNVTARDPMFRFLPPAGFIDGTYVPLDWEFLRGGGKTLYGGDCIKYFIKRVLGEDTGNLLNGDGDGKKYFKSHYPLMGNDDRAGYYTSIKPPSQAGFRLPPPFGQYMKTWIQQITGADQAVMYWGWTPDSPDDRPCFVYGRVPQILGALSTTAIEIPDKEYTVGDSNYLFSDATVRFLSETSYTDVVVWGAQLPSENAILPSLFQAKAQVSPTSALSADNTWPRTLLIQQDNINLHSDPNGLAQGIANFVMSEFDGKVPRTVSIGIPQGDAFFRWGRKIKPKMVDKSLGIDGEEFRISKVQHSFDINRDTNSLWSTTLTVRPLSNKGF